MKRDQFGQAIIAVRRRGLVPYVFATCCSAPASAGGGAVDMMRTGVADLVSSFASMLRRQQPLGCGSAYCDRGHCRCARR